MNLVCLKCTFKYEPPSIAIPFLSALQWVGHRRFLEHFAKVVTCAKRFLFCVICILPKYKCELMKSNRYFQNMKCTEPETSPEELNICRSHVASEVNKHVN